MGKTQSARKPGRGGGGPLSAAEGLHAAGKSVALPVWRIGFSGKGQAGDPLHCGGQAPGDGSIALPREFVDGRKQQRLRSAAELYLAANELDVPVRFDVAEVYDEGGSLRISYIENAFI